MCVCVCPVFFNYYYYCTYLLRLRITHIYVLATKSFSSLSAQFYKQVCSKSDKYTANEVTVCTITDTCSYHDKAQNANNSIGSLGYRSYESSISKQKMNLCDPTECDETSPQSEERIGNQCLQSFLPTVNTC